MKIRKEQWNMLDHMLEIEILLSFVLLLLAKPPIVCKARQNRTTADDAASEADIASGWLG